jgi:hypothetical protein
MNHWRFTAHRPQEPSHAGFSYVDVSTRAHSNRDDSFLGQGDFDVGHDGHWRRSKPYKFRCLKLPSRALDRRPVDGRDGGPQLLASPAWTGGMEHVIKLVTRMGLLRARTGETGQDAGTRVLAVQGAEPSGTCET